MTREEAIKFFNTVLFFGKCDCPKEEIEEYLKMAIKALEQESILDKIRADINTMPCAITSMKEVYVNRDKVINILDKYKAESEDT